MIKTEYSKKKKIRLFYIIGSILIATPIVLFIIFFKDNPISNLQSDWANFGTYFNGILTPIISIFSFIILIYIYFEIEKFSNENNHNLYILQKRIETFEELQSYIQEFSQLTIKINQIQNQAKSTLYKDKLKLNENTMIEIREITNYCANFHYFLKNFPLRYNHIFNKDIESETYQNLSKNTDILYSQMSIFYFELLSRNTDKYEKGEQPFWNFEIIIDELNIFSNELKSELKR